MINTLNLIPDDYNLYNCLLVHRKQLNHKKKSNKKSFKEYEHLVHIFETNIENKLILLYEYKKLLDFKKLAIAEKRDLKGLLLKNHNLYTFKLFENQTMEEYDFTLEQNYKICAILAHIAKNCARIEQIWAKL